MKKILWILLATMQTFPVHAQSGLYVTSTSGQVGIGTTSPIVSLDVGQKSDAIALPSGTTANRPAGGNLTNGEIRYNSSIPAMEAYVNGSWTSFVGSTNPEASFAGRLQCGGANCDNSTGSTTISYCPYKGNIKTTASQGSYTIPSACLSATTTNMYVGGIGSSSVTANTLYYIYLWNNSGTWVLDAETTGHATDSSTGIEIMNGDNTKTLVGMIRVDANKRVKTGGQINTAGDANTVASWDNRQRTNTTCAFQALSRTVTSAPASEVDAANRCNFLSWGETVYITSAQTAFVTHGGDNLLSQIGLDSVSGICSFVQIANNIGGGNLFFAVAPGGCIPSEGYHFTVLSARTGALGGARFEANTPTYVLSLQ